MSYTKREDLIKENKELKIKIKELEKIRNEQYYFWTGDADTEFLKEKCNEQEKALLFIKKCLIVGTIIFLCGACFLLGLGW